MAVLVVEKPNNNQWAVAILNAAGTYNIQYHDGTPVTVFGGVINLAGSAQTATLDCYDNASAASGEHFVQGLLAPTAPWEILDGLQLQLGLTAVLAGTVAGGGVAILVR